MTVFAQSRTVPSWGLEGSVLANFSSAAALGDRRAFPLSGTLGASLRVPVSGGFALTSGVGWENRVDTHLLGFSLGAGDHTEILYERRFRAAVVPLAAEATLGRWRVGVGAEWRHLFGAAGRTKQLVFSYPDLLGSGTVHEIVGGQPWVEDTDAYHREAMAATASVSRVWSDAGGSRSLGLRWVHGLQEERRDGGTPGKHRALHLVLGWSR